MTDTLTGAGNATDERASAYDGADAGTLARELGVASVDIYRSVSSTQDVAHRLAGAGAAAGTLVIADAQSRGRGRQGRSWASNSGAGIWLTLIERPGDMRAIDVLSLRVGLAVAAACDGFARTTIQLKWPNDLYLGDKKLGGILIESRWRELALDWVAIGLGLNVVAPTDVATATGFSRAENRLDVLRAIVPALRSAAACTGTLTAREVDDFAHRDLARGRTAIEPVGGVVQGIDAAGSLIIDTGAGLTQVRSGSLVFKD